MSSSQAPCSPLSWDAEFQKLIKEISVAIHEAKGENEKFHLARYQVAVACGGYFGPRAKELLHLRWFDLVGKSQKDLYEFKTDKHRKIYFNEKLIRIIEANFKILDPDNIHDFVLPSPTDPGKPITTAAFNKAFKNLLLRFEILTDNPSSHTLRKTFAQRVFEKHGANERALILVSDILNHSGPAVTRTYLGLRRKQIKEAYLTIS